MQSRRADEGRFGPRGLHHRQIADELDRVAEPVVVEDEHAVLPASRSSPRREARPQPVGERPAGQPARLVALEPALEIAERQQETAFAGGRLVAAQRLGRLEHGQRLAVAAEIAHCQRLAAQGGGVVGAQGAGAPVGLERLFHAVELQERVAEIDGAFREIGLERERAARGVERILEPPEVAQRAGAAVPSVGVCGLERHRRVEFFEGLGRTAELDEQLPRVGVGEGEPRVELESAAIEAQRGLGLAHCAQHVAAHGEGLGRTRVLP